MIDLKKRKEESEYQYIYRICKSKDQIGTWQEIAQILNAQLGNNYSESRYRKCWQYFEKMLAANNERFTSDDKVLSEVKETLLETRKERYKLQTEKAEINKWLRSGAKDDLFEEKIIKSIETCLGTVPSPQKVQVTNKKKYGLLNIADMHFGKEFEIYGVYNEVINEYSPEIFYNRMDKLLSETIAYCNANDLTDIKVLNLGDALDGFLRHKQAWSLRYGVTDSAIVLGDYMAQWLYKLSENLTIEYHQTTGNHGELRLLDGLKGQHSADNIEKITGHIIKIYNRNNPNFTYVENKSGLIFTEIAGFNVLGIHGEVKDLEQAIKDYTDIYDTKISYIVAGHKHHSEYKNCGVRKGYIGVGSIIGSDDFSMSLRKTSDATASFVIFEEGVGKTDEHTFVLN